MAKRRKHGWQSGRPALTLTELAVVLAILATLIALLIPAIMAARSAAAQTESKNNLRQLILAAQNFATQHNGTLPDAYGQDPGPNPEESYCFALFPYLEGQMRVFVSPADPSLSFALAERLSSYPANARVFRQEIRFPMSITDGTTQTIGFAEHYANCNGTLFSTTTYIELAGSVPATFAGNGPGVRPVTSGNPPVSVSQTAPDHATFQVAPALQICDPWVPQTPHPSGMLCAFMDGSVRVLAPNISPSTFWGAVTPAGGEQIDLD